MQLEDENGGKAGTNSKNDSSVVAKHSDVSEEEGWIAIPYKEVPENWNNAPDVHSLRTLDRSFVFPGEQVHILACLSACKQDTEIITPFKVAAVMNKNGIDQSPNNESGDTEGAKNFVSGKGELSLDGQDQKGENPSTDPQNDVSAGESLLRLEDHKRQTEILLQKFENSHFFVRFAESGEPLWSKRNSLQKFSDSSETDGKKSPAIGSQRCSKDICHISAVIDRGNFDANVSSGVARSSVKCCALPNGDIVVLLQVNVSVDFMRDPYIEILQFERYQEKSVSPENQDNSVYSDQDPCGELLKWLLPLDNTLPPPARPLSPQGISSNSGIGSTSQRPHISASSGSQLFSFGHFRSYSMSSLPPNTTPPPAPIKAASSKPSFDLEDWDQISSQKFLRKKTGIEGLLSFRGVSLERQRFSVRCGLEGIYIPGRRWRRKLEIIQPVEIHSFPADCNADDLVCVQIKNVAPSHTPDIVIYIDAITIVFAEASKSGQPSSLPIAVY
ncbi:Plant/MEB5-like protein [Quillaja saponaria]|uniref:Plant/MEB5-like protein n=1 Tax=Quillaja saponaria TaxID=32244 RepID=A0AAD7KQP3_QUISA|nr:Plant/MEB5-like protein [Quillaja saponaria]